MVRPSSVNVSVPELKLNLSDESARTVSRTMVSPFAKPAMVPAKAFGEPLVTPSSCRTLLLPSAKSTVIAGATVCPTSSVLRR